jgi:hypothetical protein
MGGRDAPDDLTQGAETQAWLAVSEDPAATVTGQYFYHRQRRDPSAHARNEASQEALLDYCAGLAATALS